MLLVRSGIYEWVEHLFAKGACCARNADSAIMLRHKCWTKESAMHGIFITEKQQQISSCVSFLCVVADLIVRLAKDKFGAIQTEYQKVRVCVCVTKIVLLCLFVCLSPFLIECSSYYIKVLTAFANQGKAIFFTGITEKVVIASDTTCEFRERYIM